MLNLTSLGVNEVIGEGQQGDEADPRDDGGVANADSDVEGHSIVSAIVTSGALRQRSNHAGDGARSRVDEDLPPLTKPLPKMREDRRKQAMTSSS